MTMAWARAPVARAATRDRHTVIVRPARTTELIEEDLLPGCKVYREAIYWGGHAATQGARPETPGAGRLLDSFRASVLPASLPARARAGGSGGRHRAPAV